MKNIIKALQAKPQGLAIKYLGSPFMVFLAVNQ
jgi:hypothetical protein